VFAHTPPGTGFSIQVEPGEDAAVILTVADYGPGFSTQDPTSRGSSTGNSTGLGLDIARRTAEATGGHLVIAASGSGAVITLVLR
jgi:signal transduction histidine kinase